MSWSQRHKLAKSFADQLGSDPVLGPKIEAARQEYAEAFAPVKAELAAAGIRAESAQQFRLEYEQTGVPYSAAVPILSRWLSLARLAAVRNDLARTISMPWARDDAMPALLEQFVRETDDSVRWAIGNGIGLLMTDEYRDTALELVLDKRLGTARGMIVEGLPRLSRTPELQSVIDQLLDDPDVYGHAVKAAGKCGLIGALTKLERLASSPDHPWIERKVNTAGIVPDRVFVMNEAIKAVQRIKKMRRPTA